MPTGSSSTVVVSGVSQFVRRVGSGTPLVHFHGEFAGTMKARLDAETEK